MPIVDRPNEQPVSLGDEPPKTPNKYDWYAFFGIEAVTMLGTYYVWKSSRSWIPPAITLVTGTLIAIKPKFAFDVTCAAVEGLVRASLDGSNRSSPSPREQHHTVIVHNRSKSHVRRHSRQPQPGRRPQSRKQNPNGHSTGQPPGQTGHRPQSRKQNPNGHSIGQTLGQTGHRPQSRKSK